jgi:hypothetical protein
LACRYIPPTLAGSSANGDIENKDFRKGLRHMNRLSVFCGKALLVLLAVAASPVQADYLNWTYTADPNVPGVSVGNTSPSGGASVTLTDFNHPQPGATSIPVIAYVTSSALTTPISFGSSGSTSSMYSLALTITDSTTHDSGTLMFNGSLSGSLSAATSSVVNTMTPVTSKSLTLDGHTYTVTIPTVTLAAPTSPQQDIMANVSVTTASTGGGNNGGSNPGGGTPQGGNTGGQGNGTPEPSCLLLGSLGFSLLGVRCLWKRRAAARS